MKKTGLERAIKRAGGISALARGVKRTRQAVQQWKKVPAGLVVLVERLTGIPRAELRPDIFSAE